MIRLNTTETLLKKFTFYAMKKKKYLKNEAKK